MFGDGVVELFGVAAAVHVRDDAVFEDEECGRGLDGQAVARQVDGTGVFVTVNAEETAALAVFSSTVFKVRLQSLARQARGEADLKDDGAAGARLFFENLIDGGFGVKHLRNLRTDHGSVPRLEKIEGHR